MQWITTIRKALYRRRLPSVFTHMKHLHPDFHLEGEGRAPGACDIVWKGRKIGHTKPLSALKKPAAADCFVIASGPSLAEIDFRQLRHRVCFGVNGSIIKSLEAGVAFPYHIVADRNFVRDRFELVRQAILSNADCLFTFRVLSAIGEREPALLNRDNLFLLTEMNLSYGVPKLSPEAFDAWAELEDDVVLHDTERLKHGRVGFSKRLEKGVFTAQTVVFVALQVVYWLGFRRVFILGMDLGSAGHEGRFYESGNAAARTRLDRDFEPYIRPSFELARQVGEAEGFEIYNLSLNSRLSADVIPKLSFEAALALSDSQPLARMSTRHPRPNPWRLDTGHSTAP